MSSPDAPDAVPPGPDVPDPDFRPREGREPDLPDSEIPDLESADDLPGEDSGETPGEDLPGTVDVPSATDSNEAEIDADADADAEVSEEIEQAEDLAESSDYDALHTDELRPESDTVEYDPPDSPGPASWQRRTPEEERRNETLDERLAQEEPEEPTDG